MKAKIEVFYKNGSKETKNIDFEHGLKFYQTICQRKNCYDEFVQYEGYNVVEAIKEADKRFICNDKDSWLEVREYDLDKPWEEMSDNEQSEALCYGYEVIYTTIEVD